MGKIKVGAKGLEEPVRGLHVLMQYQGRTLLGTIREAMVRESGVSLIVLHFNGEAWPLRPQADQVEVIE